MANSKDTIYIDIDDEITSIIDKVKSSGHGIVALVLPKRATMLQSSVNMKLLKRAADSSKKQVVLITNESGLLPLAGGVGLPVAKTLQSKPEVPAAAAAAAGVGMEELLEPEDAGTVEDFDPNEAAKKPVGELADSKDSAKSPSQAKPELTPRPIPRAAKPDDAIELDNAEAAVPEASKAKKAKNKKLKVPDFNKFRLRLILAAALVVVLVVGFILANIVLPKATIVVATTTSKVNTSQNLNLNTNTASLNISNLTVPAHLQQVSKTNSQQVATTGTKNEGQKATGSVTMTICAKNNKQVQDVPSGTGLASNSLTFITQQDATFTFTFQNCSGGGFEYQSNSVNIAAQQPGSNYNLNNATFTDPSNSDVTGTGSTSGGTDNNVQVVTQADIDNATQKLGAQDTGAIKAGLKTSLEQNGWYAITTTFNAGAPSTTTSANVGDQANNVTVTQTTAYTMFGVHQSDLQTLINSAVNSQIDTSKQSIQDDGVNQASFTVLGQSGGTAQVTMQATATVGPKLDIPGLKKQIAGKKSGDVKSIIGNNPGVKSVTVNFSPFWVSSTPKSTSKITIKFQKAS